MVIVKMQELMKKIVYAIAALALIFTGCAKELDNATKENFSKVRLRVKVADQIQTKVSADNDGSYHWQAGDIISVLNNNGDSYPFETESGGSEVDFSASSWSGDLGKYAMYPASSTHTALDDEVSFNLPESYIWSANATNMPMLGKITSSVATFHSVAGVLKLTIIGVPDDATELWFTATNKNITGNCTISDASQNGVFLSVADAGLTGKTVVFNFDGHRSDNMVFYIPLPVGTIDGFTIEFDDSEHTSKTTTKNVAIARNSIVIAPVLNLSATTPTVLLNETFGSYTGSVGSYDFTGTSTYDGTTSSLDYSVSNSGVNISDVTSSTITSNNVFFPNSGQYDFIMEGIKLEGASSITVSYKANKTNLSVLYSVDGSDFTEATASSSVGDNSFNVSVSGSYLTLKFHNTAKTTNNRLDDIKVVAELASSAIPTITTGSDAITISAGSLSSSVSSVKLADPIDASGISFVIDPSSTWLSVAEIIDGDIETGNAKVRITASSYNHEESPRVGYVYFRATGAISKTITVTQNPSIVSKPTLDSPSGAADGFEVTWTGDSKAKSYVGYYFNHELDPSDDPTLGTPLKITNEGSVYTATQGDLDVITEDQTYYYYIKVNEVADAYADKYAASIQWASGNVTCTSVTDYSITYTSTITLSTSGGTAVSSAKVIINETEYEALKAGATGKTGVIKMTVPSGASKLYLHMAGWNGDETTVTITPADKVTKINGSSTNSITPTQDSGISGTGSTYTLGAQAKAPNDYYYVIDLTGITSNTELTLTANANKRRFVIWGVNAE